MSRTPPKGTPAPQWGRGGMDNLGPGNWHGSSGPPDNRPPSGSGGNKGIFSDCLPRAAVLLLIAFASAVLDIAGLVDIFGGAA